ncbi:MAG: hypothetical protein Q4C65_13015 [Eubacteriales bacterium]|nr:hypothetical protein [Eubacteriales bacterium]
MKKLCIDFLKCGVTGWCIEILVSSFESFRRREPTLTGHTSLLMFPIYGAACLLRPLCILLRRSHWALRGLVYMLCIFGAEYASGRFLQKKGRCPWHYGRSGWNVKKVIRLDFAPAWFLVGLLFERLVMGKGKNIDETVPVRRAP